MAKTILTCMQSSSAFSSKNPTCDPTINYVTQKFFCVELKASIMAAEQTMVALLHKTEQVAPCFLPECYNALFFEILQARNGELTLFTHMNFEAVSETVLLLSRFVFNDLLYDLLYCIISDLMMQAVFSTGSWIPT